MRQQIFHFSLFTFHFLFVPLNCVRKYSRSEKTKKVWFFAHLFVPLNCVRKYSRSEKPKKVWFFAHLFVPLHTFYINKVKDNNE